MAAAKGTARTTKTGRSSRRAGGGRTGGRTGAPARTLAERELERAPGMLGLFGRAAVGALPLGSLPLVSALPGVGGRRAADVPEDALVLSDARTDLERLAAYTRVTGFTLRRTLPVTYPHMLAFPLQLALMTDPRFPFGAMGLVHIDNRITQHRPIGTAEPLTLKVWAEPLADHPKGRQVAVRTEARVGGEVVWEEVSTNLRRGRPHEDASARSVPSTTELPASATWRLPGDLGRRYAAVSGDYNPIHVHPLSARLFGFPGAIAHGMWTKARCLAAMEPRLPGAYTVEVAFKRPIVLPATVTFAERRAGPADGGAISFGVRDGRKDVPHLDGALTPVTLASP